MIRRTRIATWSVVVATLLSTACRNYVPLAAPTVAPGAKLQVRLTDRGRADVASFVGPGANTLEGRVTRYDDSVVVLSVTELARLNGQEETWAGESVTVSRSGIANVAEPRISVSRTALLATMIAAGAVAIALSLGGGGGVGGGKSGPPVGTQ
jgi:hypothetical protein